MKKVSIIIPCYNAAETIDRLMVSIIEQTMPMTAFEVILINDASSDSTLEHLLVWESEFENDIMVVNCEKNGGLSVARNIGIQYASGEYIAFIDADDWIAKNYFERMIGLAQTTASDIVICGHDRPMFYTKQKCAEQGTEKVYDLTDVDTRKKFLVNHVYTTSVCWKLFKRTQFVEWKLCFPEHLHYEDGYVSYLTFLGAKRIVVCSDILYHYYKNAIGIMQSGNEGQQLERAVVLVKLHDECRKLGYTEIYYDELEFIFIRKFYSEIIEVMFRTFETVDYVVICGICDYLNTHFPNWEQNKYLNNEESSMDRLFMQIKKNAFDEQQIEQFRSVFLKKIYAKDFVQNPCAKDVRCFMYPTKDNMLHILENMRTKEDCTRLFEVLTVFPVGDSLEIVPATCGAEVNEHEFYRYWWARQMVLAYMKDMVQRGNDTFGLLGYVLKMINKKEQE